MKRSVYVSQISPFCFLLACLCVAPSYAVGNIPILDSYPRCNYKVLDTVEVKTQIDLPANALRPEQYERAFNKIVSKLNRLAQEQSADSIILTAINDINTSRQSYMSYSAELLQSCSTDLSIPKRGAKIGSKGKRQISFSDMSFEIENRLTINMPVLEKRRQPLLKHHNVSLEDGAYGIDLRASEANVLETFGTPTVSINLDKRAKILMYGRKHSIGLIDNEVVAISSENQLFGSDLNNLLEFDDRFDDLKWTINDALKEQKLIPDEYLASLNNNEVVLSNEDTSLRIKTTKYTSKNALSYVPESFRLSLKEKPIFKFAKPPNSAEILSFISERLLQNKTYFVLSEIPGSPTIVAWLSPSKRLYTFGQHIAIEFIGEKIKTIHIFEKLFTQDSPLFLNQKWAFAKYYEGMSIDKAKEIAGDKGSYINQSLEVIEDGFTLYLYFYESKGVEKLYAAEIKFY